ncbi:Uncharacterized protein QTN25_003585 [Entamoeba marina]
MPCLSTLVCFFTIIKVSLSYCSTDYFIESISNINNSDDILSTVTMNDDCYNVIPNYKEVITAFTQNQACYFHESLFYMNYSGISVPRCGEFYEITAPSMRRTYCMFAGVFSSTATNNTLEYAKHMILVHNDLFQYLTFNGLLNNQNKTQISLEAVDAPYTFIPKLHILELESDILSVIPYNNNKLMAFLVFNDTKYYVEDDGTYKVYVPSTLQTGSLYTFYYISFSNDVISFNTADPFYPNSIIIGSAQLEREVSDNKCTFLPNQIIWNSTVSSDDTQLFEWSIEFFSSSIGDAKTLKGESLYFFTRSNTSTIIFYYPSHFKIPFHFKYLEGMFDFYHSETRISSVSLARYDDGVIEYVDDNCKDLATQTNLTLSDSSSYLCGYLTHLTQRCTGFNNAIIIQFETIANSFIILKSAYLKEQVTS